MRVKLDAGGTTSTSHWLRIGSARIRTLANDKWRRAVQGDNSGRNSNGFANSCRDRSCAIARRSRTGVASLFASILTSRSSAHSRSSTVELTHIQCLPRHASAHAYCWYDNCRSDAQAHSAALCQLWERHQLLHSCFFEHATDNINAHLLGYLERKHVFAYQLHDNSQQG